MAADNVDVLIVGAGPTGLLLAGDLAAAGVPVTVLERRQGNQDLSRACAVHARTLELLDARGIADDLIARGHVLDRLHLFGQIDVDLARLPSRFGFILITPQYHTERLLAERARSFGAQIIEGMEVTALRPANEGAHVQASGAAGKCRTFTPSFVVGADGARSTVREMLSLPFPGSSALRSVMIADVRLAQAPPETVTVHAADAGYVFLAPFGDGWYRVVAWNRHRQVPPTDPVDLCEIGDVTKKVLGTDFGMRDARWLARYHCDERQVPRYRCGPVFLAGDAAHVHAPAGGLGMNAGLQDAANLSWKLAAVARGSASPRLLDSYQEERHPAGKSALRLSRNLFCGLGATRLTGVPASGPAARADAVADRVAEAMSGLDAAYRSGNGAHRLVGRRAPDLRLTGADHCRLYEALREGKFVLLDGESQRDPANRTATRWRGRVLLATPRAPQARLSLIRPDGYVAWASDVTDSSRRREALRQALTRWCGAGAVPASAFVTAAR